MMLELPQVIQCVGSSSTSTSSSSTTTPVNKSFVKWKSISVGLCSYGQG